MNFSTYIFVGSIYSLVVLLYNIFVAKTDYNDTNLFCKLAAYIFDLFLWPVGLILDVAGRLKRASK